MLRIVTVASLIALAACGAITGPPATGASSSAPEAVSQADHGAVGNASNPFNQGGGGHY